MNHCCLTFADVINSSKFLCKPIFTGQVAFWSPGYLVSYPPCLFLNNIVWHYDTSYPDTQINNNSQNNHMQIFFKNHLNIGFWLLLSWMKWSSDMVVMSVEMVWGPPRGKAEWNKMAKMKHQTKWKCWKIDEEMNFFWIELWGFLNSIQKHEEWGVDRSHINESLNHLQVLVGCPLGMTRWKKIIKMTLCFEIMIFARKKIVMDLDKGSFI